MDIVTKNKLAVSLFIIAAFLRLYKLNEFITFLGDQGRDAIIIKRIITLEKFPAIGPSTSIGHAFLGPFYYYLVSPFLLLFNFNPLGLAFAVAVISIAGIIAAYFVIKKELNRTVALFFLIFATFSQVNIDYSRFSWNPNPLFVFAFFTLYFFYKFFETRKYIYAIAAGSFFAFSIQLHYLAILLIPSLVIFAFFKLFKTAAKIDLLKGLLLSIVSFVFFSAPLIIFDLRHDFINSKSLLKLSSEQQTDTNASYMSHLTQTIDSFFAHILTFNIHDILALILFGSLILYYVFNVKKNKLHSFIHLNLLTVFTYILTFAIVDSPRYPHYYIAIYFSFYLVAAYLLSLISTNKLTKFVFIPLLLIAYIILNARSYFFFYSAPNNQIQRAEKIALSIIERKPAVPYQVVALPSTETDGHIRYFLEMNYERPLPADTLGEPKELYVICFEECEVYGNAQWQIAAFKDGITDTMWEAEGVTIYKQIHGK